MWLINVDTRDLQWHSNDMLHQYAILSHTWTEDEVTFQDMRPLVDPRVYKKAGYRKLDFACQRAKADGLSWVWVDTCCIDKSSSAELSQAINAMFDWYRRAKLCYAHLADYDSNIRWDEYPYKPDHAFCMSRWFTRGWTLQELIAPGVLRFYDQHFRFLCSRKQIVWSLVSITGVAATLLARNEAEAGEVRGILDSYSVAKRMSWASDRRTTRTEDEAYSLFGLFDVNLPMLYGEGHKAFTRLQEEIIRTSTNHSILVHNDPDLLALGPRAFASYGDVMMDPSLKYASQPYEMTNLGLRMTLGVSRTPIHTLRSKEKGMLSMALDCVTLSVDPKEPLKRYYLTLLPVNGTTNVYYLDREFTTVVAAPKPLTDYIPETVFILREYKAPLDRYDIIYDFNTTMDVQDGEVEEM